jgi:hypothetical protein
MEDVMKSRGFAFAHVATTLAVARASSHQSFTVRLVAGRLGTVRDAGFGK